MKEETVGRWRRKQCEVGRGSIWNMEEVIVEEGGRNSGNMVEETVGDGRGNRWNMEEVIVEDGGRNSGNLSIW